MAQPEHITDSIIVGGNVTEIFNMWRNFENFPQFMKYIKSVKRTGDRTSHWVMEGPLGKDIEWDAQTTRLEENKRIAWASTGGDIQTSGQVTFNQLPDNQTEVTVMLHYEPPAGLAGQVGAALFSKPEKQLQEDLRNFKAYAERMYERTSLGSR